MCFHDIFFPLQQSRIPFAYYYIYPTLHSDDSSYVEGIKAKRTNDCAHECIVISIGSFRLFSSHSLSLRFFCLFFHYIIWSGRTNLILFTLIRYIKSGRMWMDVWIWIYVWVCVVSFNRNNQIKWEKWNTCQWNILLLLLFCCSCFHFHSNGAHFILWNNCSLREHKVTTFTMKNNCFSQCMSIDSLL